MARIFRKLDPLPDRCHVLLIGAPRSGTTLLASMIARHSEVSMINEDVTGRVLRKLLGRSVTGNKLCVPNQIQLDRKSGFGSRLLKNLGLIREAPRSKYSITDYLELPNLKVIAIMRDGNDSISSMVSRGGSGLKKAARRWGEAIETIWKIKCRHETRILIVTFEDLVSSPENTIQKACRFLDLDFQAQMLDGHKHNPYYPEAELKKDRAHRHKMEKIDLGVERLVPAAFQKYQELSAYVQEKRS